MLRHMFDSISWTIFKGEQSTTRRLHVKGEPAICSQIVALSGVVGAGPLREFVKAARWPSIFLQSSLIQGHTFRRDSE